MIPVAEYRRRRERLMQLLVPDGVALIPGARRRYRNRDAEYHFRQDSDFYYLTGFTEPDALLVLAPGRRHGQSILFCAERDAEDERWHGERLGPERASTALGLDDAFPSADLADILPGLLENSSRIYLDLGQHPEFDQELLRWLPHLRHPDGSLAHGGIQPLTHQLHDLRLYKSAAEQRLLREAARISVAAHARAMRAAAPGLPELLLEAEILHEFMRQGARFPAYPSMVAAGRNACVLHYTANSGLLREQDLVLIDAGCEYAHYAADLTRTFPVSGRFSGPQRALYEVVLQAQQAAIDVAIPGNTINDPHQVALAMMIEGLQALGLLKGSVAEILASGSYRRFCVHRSTHWLGLDVHDVGEYQVGDAWRVLEPGMVLSIEPGIYVPDAADIPAAFRGMGIRIEDELLVTRQAPDVLTAEAPKTIADIEAWMRRCKKI